MVKEMISGVLKEEQNRRLRVQLLRVRRKKYS
jgi:hypothetical protein